MNFNLKLLLILSVFGSVTSLSYSAEAKEKSENPIFYQIRDRLMDNLSPEIGNHNAVGRAEYYDTVSKFLEENPESINIRDSQGRTLLMHIVEAALRAGDVINMFQDRSYQPGYLHITDENDPLQRLFKVNEDLFRRGMSDSPIVVENGKLIREGKLNRVVDDRINLIDTIFLLLDKGADLKAKDNKGKTAFDYTIFNMVLRRKGGVYHWEDNFVQSILNSAQEERNEEIRKVLEGKMLGDLANIVCEY